MDDPGEVVDPTVRPLFPDGPVALVPLLSRITLLLRSQHWLAAVPLEPELPLVPVEPELPLLPLEPPDDCATTLVVKQSASAKLIAAGEKSPAIVWRPERRCDDLLFSIQLDIKLAPRVFAFATHGKYESRNL